MSATGLDVFDKTLETTNIWLDEIMNDIGPDRQVAWKVLSVVLHKTRDRLPFELAVHLGAELPLLIRGIYYDQFEPGKQPTHCRNLEDFTNEIGAWLRDTRRISPSLAVQAVWATLSRHVPPSEIREVQDALPHDLREFWHAAEEALVMPQLSEGRYSRPGSESPARQSSGTQPLQGGPH